ncbi:MAG: thioredoxin family protein [Terriglobales bacterium]
MIRTLARVFTSYWILALCCAAQSIPPGLNAAIEQWKTAVTAADLAALQSLYSTNPPSVIVSSDGKQQFPLSAETDFWSQTRAAGMKQPAVSVLNAESKNGMMIVSVEVAFRASTPSGVRQRYVLEQQGWMQQPQGWRIVVSSHTPVLKMRPVGKLNPHLYEKDADAKAQIREALAKAARAHKRVLLVFGGNWCYDCHVLDAAFHQSDVSPLLSANFLVVHVDIGEMNKNLDVAQKYGVPIDKGVPALAVLAPDGTLLYSQQHGEFESARSMDPDDLLAFLKKWKPAAAR